ncbi:MAG: hypothetical protein GX871_07220 [Microbacteriaceae bacterium]|jgi:hypothetical protein|nr:hypothetical protein [Microbacteriaceae bacterium]HOA86390.1 hypothetical protein [Microbacteriaceae bacterium]HPZ34222.1 hypothetical protein [Microbacteriaceae bacterium]HQC93995.1 hypothetical protein [Microbacteriaceae bacterium]
MIVIGGLAALIGLLLFQRALGMTLRANPRSRIPHFRNPLAAPPGSIGLRVLGTALMVLGAIMLAFVGWYWPLVILLLGPVAAFFAIFAHNGRVARERRR